MMKSIIEYKEDRSAKQAALDAHLVKFETDGALVYTDADNTVSLGFEADIRTIDAEIKKLEDFERMKTANIDRRLASERKGSPEKQAVKRYSLMNMIRSQVPNDTSIYRKLDGAELEIHQEAEREMKALGQGLQGVGVPSFFFQPKTRALDITNATAGQETVQTDVMDLIGFLSPRLISEALGAQVMTGLVGDVQFPRNNAQGSGDWEGEVDAGAEIDPTFNTVTMTPHRFGGYTIYSKQLLRQSSIGVENFVRGNISNLIGQAIDTAYINGTGAAPTGLLNTAGIGDTPTAGGAGAVPTWAEVVGNETKVSVANADFGRLAYLTTPGIRGLFKQTLKTAAIGGYIWDDNPQGALPGEGMMNGYRSVVSTLVPSTLTEGTGTGLHAIIFGNFADSAIGQWGGIDFVVDPYSLVRSAQIQIVANIWVDVAFFHPASFSATLDAALS